MTVCRTCFSSALRGASLLVALVLAGPAAAQAPYPSKPIRAVNPFPPGGSIDVVGRPVFERMREPLGQPVVMDYRPGAATMIAASFVARAAPDGYTLLVTAGQHAVVPNVHSKVPYDVVKDFIPVSLLARSPYVLVVHPSVPAKNLKQLISLAKSMPGKLSFSSAGLASGFHMAGELLKVETGINMLHVPYKGGAPAAAAVAGGEVEMTFGSPPVLLPLVEAKRLRAITVSSPERFALFPGVPTMKESGLTDFRALSWYGVFVPAGTPSDIVAMLAAQIDRAVKTPEVRKVFAAGGLEPGGGTPQEFAALFMSDLKKWATVAKKAGVRLD
jgi:tripartite-type tricarboxylate transporter receptor subunit TctC